MRNTTKLKHILMLHTVSFDQDDDGLITIILHHKTSGEIWEHTSRSYSILISKAYGHFKKGLKDTEKALKE
jgi:hypothetical protein